MVSYVTPLGSVGLGSGSLRASPRLVSSIDRQRMGLPQIMSLGETSHLSWSKMTRPLPSGTSTSPPGKR